MKNNKGVTLVSLVAAMLIMMILSTITIKVSLDTYDTMKVQNFIGKMKVIQAKVDNFAEENINVEDFGFTKLSDISSTSSEDYALFSQIISAPEEYNIDTSNSWNETIDGNIDNYYYFTPADLEKKLGLKNQDMTVIINFVTRNVITKNAVKEEDIKYYRQYELAGGEKLQQDQTRIVLSELNVGDYVTYSPSGSYTWQAEYASSDLATDGSADVALASGTSVTSGKQNMSISSWRVFSIDERTGEVELVPSAPTTGTVRLQGAQGYNNAVKLLNDACSNLYGNSSKGISARSISMKDIEGAMIDEALAEAHSYENPNNSNLKWGEQTANPYTARKQYPTIYAKENLSVINGNENNNGLGMSDQTALIGRTDDGAELGKITTATSIQPYQTYWTKDNAFMQTAFKGDGYNLLIPSGTATHYWVASRCVEALSGNCGFLVSYIGSGYVNAYWISGSSGSAYNYARALFPVVSLNATLINGNATDGWSVE